MSKCWDVYCKDCDVKSGITNANHREDLMRELVRHRHAIAAIVPLLNDSDVTLTLGGAGYDFDPSWFAKHHEHNLVPMSEYGDVLDDLCEHRRCGKRGELQQLRVDKKSWLLCEECHGAATDLLSDSIEKEPEQ